MIGPNITAKASCLGCEYCKQTRYRVQGDSGYDYHCTKDGDDKYIGDCSYTTPDWCPYLRDAVAEFTSDFRLTN